MKIFSRQSSASSRQPPASSRQPPASSLQPPASSRIRRGLLTVWLRRSLRTHLRGVALTTIAVVAMCACAFPADLLFDIPAVGRVALLVFFFGLTGTIMFRQWLSRLRRFDAEAASLFVEREHPELKGLLSSYVELTGDRHDAVIGSEELKKIVAAQAADAARPVRFGAAVSFRPIRAAAAGAVAAALLVVAAVQFWPRHVDIFAQRMFGADIAYPTKTQIVDITGNRTVKKGDAITVTARAVGQTPRTGNLFVRRRNEGWQMLELSSHDGNRFSHAIDSLLTSFSYYYQVGDARSDVYSVRVVPPPGIVEASMRVAPPAYTRVTPYETDNLNLEIPEGSEIRWRIRCDTALAAAELAFGDTNTIPLDLSADGLEVSGRLSLRESVAYHLRWRRRDARFDYETARYRIYVMPDRKPEVAILRPSGNVKATANKVLTVRFQAKDDYGLGEAWLVYAINEGNEMIVSLGDLPQAADQDGPPRFGVWPIVWDIHQDIQDVRKGDVISYAIEVADIRGDDPAVRSRSQMQNLTIVSYSEYQTYVFSKLAATQEALAGVQIEARKGQQAVSALLERATKE